MSSHIRSEFEFQDKLQHGNDSSQAILQIKPKNYYKKLLIPLAVVSAIVAIIGRLTFEQWVDSSWDLIIGTTTLCSILAAVACVGFILQARLEYSRVTYILTPDYAIRRKDGIPKSVAQVDLTEVGQVFVDSKGLDRFFGVGTIELSVPKLALIEPPLRKTLSRGLAHGLGGLLVAYAFRHHDDSTIAMKFEFVENPTEVYSLIRKTIASARKS